MSTKVCQVHVLSSLDATVMVSGRNNYNDQKGYSLVNDRRIRCAIGEHRDAYPCNTVIDLLEAFRLAVTPHNHLIEVESHGKAPAKVREEKVVSEHCCGPCNRLIGGDGKTNVQHNQLSYTKVTFAKKMAEKAPMMVPHKYMMSLIG